MSLANVKKVYIGHASLYKYVVYIVYMYVCVYIVELYIVLLLLSIKRAQQLKILKRNEPSVGFWLYKCKNNNNKKYWKNSKFIKRQEQSFTHTHAHTQN